MKGPNSSGLAPLSPFFILFQPHWPLGSMNLKVTFSLPRVFALVFPLVGMLFHLFVPQLVPGSLGLSLNVTSSERLSLLTQQSLSIT